MSFEFSDDSDDDMKDENIDLYKILNIKRNATQNEIKKSYRKLAKKYHPDRTQTNKTEFKKKFQEINNAHKILSDLKKRKVYDKHGMKGLEQKNLIPKNSEGIKDIFDIFDSDSDDDRKDEYNKDNKAKPIKFDTYISFEEAYYGTSKQIKYEVNVLSKKKKGYSMKTKYETQKIDIPRGVKNLHKITLKNVGNCELNKKRGDVIFTINIDEYDRRTINHFNKTQTHKTEYKKQSQEIDDEYGVNGLGQRNIFPQNSTNNKSAPIEFNIFISLAGAYYGITTQFKYEVNISCYFCGDNSHKKIVCGTCRGKGIIQKNEIHNIKIAKGIENLNQMILPNVGNCEPNKERGDVIFTINIVKNNVFQRDGNDLYLKEYFRKDKKNEMVNLKGGGMPIKGTENILGIPQYGDLYLPKFIGIFDVVAPELQYWEPYFVYANI